MRYDARFFESFIFLYFALVVLSSWGLLILDVIDHHVPPFLIRTVNVLDVRNVPTNIPACLLQCLYEQFL